MDLHDVYMIQSRVSDGVVCYTVEIWSRVSPSRRAQRGSCILASRGYAVLNVDVGNIVSTKFPCSRVRLLRLSSVPRPCRRRRRRRRSCRRRRCPRCSGVSLLPEAAALTLTSHRSSSSSSSSLFFPHFRPLGRFARSLWLQRPGAFGPRFHGDRCWHDERARRTEEEERVDETGGWGGGDGKVA